MGAEFLKNEGIFLWLYFSTEEDLLLSEEMDLEGFFLSKEGLDLFSMELDREYFLPRPFESKDCKESLEVDLDLTFPLPALLPRSSSIFFLSRI